MHYRKRQSSQQKQNDFRQNPKRSFRRNNKSLSSLDLSLFINKAESVHVEEKIIENNFSDFRLVPQLLTNITALGYNKPTPIQDQAIPVILSGKDVVGVANTGTGKTAAFLIPIIQKLNQYPQEKLLVVAPTRELAVQIHDVCKLLTKNMNIFSVLCIGGVGMYSQINSLERNPHVVIGTPGRLKDLEKRKKLSLQNYATIVLDEVDRMLDMGFINDVRYMISRLPTVRQSLFFSATVSKEVQGIMINFLKNPQTISVKTQDTAKNIEQNVIKTFGKPKVDILDDLLSQKGFDKVLVFGRTKHGMEKLYRLLEKKGYRVAAIHGNKNQNQRQRALQEFKQNRIQVLLATDIASRGLDIDRVTHVINYDLPESYEDYIHRIGRTGRANNRGIALTLID